MKKIVPDNAVLIPEQAERVFKGQIFEVYQWPQPMFDGSTATFEMLRRPDTVAVLAVTGDKIIVLDDEQPGVGKRKSLITGRIDKPDLSPLSAAKREVLEETGYEFNNWRLISVVQPHVKIEWFVHFFLAWDGKKTAQPHLDPGEKIEVHELSFEEVKKLALNKAGYMGEVKDIFEGKESVEDLINLPEFKGRPVA